MSVPYVGHVLNGWTKNYNCYLVTQNIINYTTQNIAEVKTIPLFVVPLKPYIVERKPEKERAWKWFSIIEQVQYKELYINDLILINDIFFRIDSKQSWDNSGYRRYQATEYYSGDGPIYSIIYKKNGADSGTVPTQYAYVNEATVTIVDENTLSKTGYIFSGWNTAADGSGTSYEEYDTVTIDSENITLYAQWEEESE